MNRIPSNGNQPNCTAMLTGLNRRNTLGLLGADGYRAFAPDWLGHGDSDKPDPSAFSCSEADYLSELSSFVDAVGIRKPFALVVQVGGVGCCRVCIRRSDGQECR